MAEDSRFDSRFSDPPLSSRSPASGMIHKNTETMITVDCLFHYDDLSQIIFHFRPRRLITEKEINRYEEALRALDRSYLIL